VGNLALDPHRLAAGKGDGMHLLSLAILAVLASALLIATHTFAGDGVVTLADLTPRQTERVHANATPLPRLRLSQDDDTDDDSDTRSCSLKCGIYYGHAHCQAAQRCVCSCAREPICACR
jgi:hypothetical protein